MRKFVWVFLIIILVVPFALGQPSNGLVEDATTFAAAAGISVDEALRRLQLQKTVGELDAALEAEESATFAGLWIQHEPQYRIVVRFTDRAAEARLRQRVAGGPLADLIETRPARWSLAELQSRRQQVRGHARNGKVAFNSDINVFENRVEMYVREPEALSAALGKARAHIPEGVVVQRRAELFVTEEALVGGRQLNTCTGGFTVRATTGELGISTAGHCNSHQFYNTTLVPMRAERYGGDADLQWHSGCDTLEVTNQFESGLGLRACTATQSRAYQAIGTIVCKNGMTTGRTCGKIASNTFDRGPEFNNTAVLVDGDELRINQSENGDSGGPWFVDGTAYGIHSGSPGSTSLDAIYTPVNYLADIGVRVLTYNPGICNLLPKPTFTWTRSLDGVNFDASASSDPDGSLVRYDWKFGDGTTAITTSPRIFHAYPRETATYSVTLIVTDNEGQRNGLTTDVELCYPILACREN